MASGPKILHYTWEDLLSPVQIDNWFVDKIRKCLLDIKANSAMPAYSFLRRLFDSIGEFLLACPKSDAAVILFRLLEQFDEETLRTTTAIGKNGIIEGPISMIEFMIWVSSAFIKKPVSVVLGNVPRISL